MSEQTVLSSLAHLLLGLSCGHGSFPFWWAGCRLQEAEAAGQECQRCVGGGVSKMREGARGIGLGENEMGI